MGTDRLALPANFNMLWQSMAQVFRATLNSTQGCFSSFVSLRSETESNRHQLIRFGGSEARLFNPFGYLRHVRRPPWHDKMV